MSQANMELQRLLRLLSEEAHKVEHDAYAAGWRDCRNTIIKAINAISDVPPPPSNAVYRYDSESPAAHAAGDGAAPPSFPN
jgi:hypothetical protein